MVPTVVQPSPIHGLGLFALEAIPTGTIVWAYVPGLDIVLSQQEYAQTIGTIRQFIDRYGFTVRDGLLLCLDNARFINHAETPTLYSPDLDGGYGAAIAIRDISPGEELTEDYKSFDPVFAGRFL